VDYTLIVQGLVIVVVIGGVYSLWQTTRAYGGLVGAALKWIGLGMIVFAVVALNRSLGNLVLGSIASDFFSETIENILLLLGLAFSGFGFSRLTKIAK